MSIPLNDTLRSMQWERAKGELNAMRPTFYAGGDAPTRRQLDESQARYERFAKVLDKFITDIEEGCFHE